MRFFFNRRFWLRFVPLAGSLLLGSVPNAFAGESDPPPQAESLAMRDLRTAVEREAIVWERLDGSADDIMEQRRAQADFEAVADTYQTIVRANPEFAEAWAAYGLLLSRLGERDTAMRFFLRANKLDPNIPMVKNQLGNFLAEDGDYTGALGYYLAAIELNEGEALYHYQLGSLLVAYRDFFIDDGLFDRATIDQKMQEAFRMAAELASNEWGYIYRYAESYYDLETPDWETALAGWEALESKASDGVETQIVLLHQARVQVELGHNDKASALLEAITEPVLQQSKQTVVDQLNQSRKE